MFPLAKGSYSFNGANEQEWQISRNTNTKFVVYGMLIIFEVVVHFYKLEDSL
jgi:hypothetical protein